MTIDVLSPEFDRRMAAQIKEFEACTELAKQHERLKLTPCVDIDYAEVRHCYESALRDFIDALQDNGRFPRNLQKSVAIESVTEVLDDPRSCANCLHRKRGQFSGARWWFCARCGEECDTALRRGACTLSLKFWSPRPPAGSFWSRLKALFFGD